MISLLSQFVVPSFSFEHNKSIGAGVNSLHSFGGALLLARFASSHKITLQLFFERENARFWNVI